MALVVPLVLMEVQAPLGSGDGGMEVLARVEVLVMAVVLANGRSAGNTGGTGNGCVGATGTKRPCW